jgi:hypothetical protein
MYGDIQMLAVLRVSPVAGANVLAGEIVDIVFSVPNLDASTDVVLSIIPVTGIGTATIVPGNVGNNNEVTGSVSSATNGDGGINITTAFVFDIVIARTRSKNSSVI